MYLLFENEDEAKARTEEAGKQKNLSYHKTGKGTRYWWGWTTSEAEGGSRSALRIKDNDEEKSLLTEDEIAALVEELPEDWVHPPSPAQHDD